MSKVKLAAIVIAAAAILPGESLFAQASTGFNTRTRYNAPGVIGGAGQLGRPTQQNQLMRAGGAQRNRPRRNSTPALSPYLNLVPGVPNSFGGQFLLRTIPQQEFERANRDLGRRLDTLQNDVRGAEERIYSGLGMSGKRVSFFNYGSYYNFGGP
jgi:hypothetical protein